MKRPLHVRLALAVRSLAACASAIVVSGRGSGAQPQDTALEELLRLHHLHRVAAADEPW